MGVHHESTVFGDVRANVVHGRSGVGACELAFGHFRNPPANRLASTEALHSFLAKLNAAQIAEVIKQLKADGVIKVSGKKLVYPVPGAP